MRLRSRRRDHLSKVAIVDVRAILVVEKIGSKLVSGRVLSPLHKSTGTNRMDYSLPDALVLIGCATSNILHAAREKKKRKKGRGRTCVGCRTPFFFFRRTELLMEMGITVDGGGHLLCSNTLLLCRGVYIRLSFILIWLARPKILDGAKQGFSRRNETNDHEQPRSVPFGSTRSNRVMARPQGVRLRVRWSSRPPCAR